MLTPPHRQTPRAMPNGRGWVRPAIRPAHGYILLTLLFIIVGVSTLYFVANPKNRAVENKTTDFVQMSAIKAAIISRGMRGKGALSSTIIYPGINDYPGTLPCPEDTASDAIGKVKEGEEKNTCSDDSVRDNYLGRLAWRALGITNLVDSQGARHWYFVNTAYTKTKDKEQHHKSINAEYDPTKNDVDSPNRKMYWADDGIGEGEEVVAIIFAPQKPQNGQTRKSAYSSTDLPDPENYLEIVRDVSEAGKIVVRRRTDKCIDAGKCASGNLSNDFVVTITKSEWQKAAQQRVGETLLYCMNRFRENEADKPLPAGYDLQTASGRKFDPATFYFETANQPVNIAPALGVYDRYPRTCFDELVAGVCNSIVGSDADATLFFAKGDLALDSDSDLTGALAGTSGNCKFDKTKTYDPLTLSSLITPKLGMSTGKCSDFVTHYPRYPQICFSTGCAITSTDQESIADFYSQQDVINTMPCEFNKIKSYPSSLNSKISALLPSSTTSCAELMITPVQSVSNNDEICNNIFNRFTDSSAIPPYEHADNPNFNKLMIPDGVWDDNNTDPSGRILYPFCLKNSPNTNCPIDRWAAAWVNSVFPAYAPKSCKTNYELYEKAIKDGTITTAIRNAVFDHCFKVQTSRGCRITNTALIFPGPSLAGVSREPTPLYARGGTVAILGDDDMATQLGNYRQDMIDNPKKYFEDFTYTDVDGNTVTINNKDAINNNTDPTFVQQSATSTFNDQVFFNDLGACPTLP